ncbi:hypothetical protein DRW41_21900 [Neobacillus piezotolerans]|uniref:Uncharacterized protein n=1 Tax=Neobacillus piezotolerans TaxID=2259171 RepID=A0A3D8GKA6_9BACI|nr:hypothetical protein [Neobacillus piezotolerans]RDU34752.1 hypothetical protein DRW41_21900 [Neobacillus piezotolerans]
MAAIFAIAFVLFQSFSIPVLAATIKPWSGNPWTGDSWEGNPWSGNKLKWEGDPWEGQGTKGNSWTGDLTDPGNPWSGTDWSSIPWYLDPWSAEGWTANGWNANGWTADSWAANGWNANGWTADSWAANGWNANGWNGDSWAANGWTANGWTANGWTANGWTSNGWQGNIPVIGGGWSGNSWNVTPNNPGGANKGNVPIPYVIPNNGGFMPYTLPNPPGKNGEGPSKYSGYDWFKFGMKDVGTGSYSLMKEQQINFSNLKKWSPQSKEFYLELLKASYKFSAKDIDLLEVGPAGLDVPKTFLDYKNNLNNANTAYGVGLNKVALGLANPQDAINNFKGTDLATIRGQILTAGQQAFNKAAQFKNLAPLGRLNVVSAAVGAGFSGIDTGRNIWDLHKAKNSAEKLKANSSLNQSSGELLRTVGTGIAMFPGGQVVGGALISSGAALWAGGTLVKHWPTIKNAPGNLANRVKSGLKKLKGFFS